MPAVFQPADTVLVCRREQFREAAITLSCFPRETPPPLLVMEPPPCTEQEYSDLYEAYRSMRNLRDEAMGTSAAREKTLERGMAEGWSNEEIDRRIQALTPFRLWVKRQRQMAGLLKGLSLRRAIFLFEATQRDMSVIEPVPVDRLSDTRQPLLVSGIEWVTLLPAKLGQELGRHAWQTIRHGDAVPQSELEVSGDAVSVIAGLHRALQAGILLRITANGCAAPPVTIVSKSGVLAEEAVLVEASEDAAKLVAVHYALRQNATLCVTTTPDTVPIEKIREAIQASQEVGGGNAVELLRAMEKTVSATVPDEVVEAVGDSPVTAFTSGVPYHLMKRGGADWSKKPIGLMTGDALLLCPIELFGQPPQSQARFNLLFDTGYFHTSETNGVLEQMRTVSTFPLLLQGAAASNTALIAMGPAPLELLYFNTHGSEQAILLKDMPLPAYKLMQRITLQSQPVVFNNSCLSWTGVGREFISAGARGYLGTLWSVNAQQAATFAIAVMARIIAGQKPITDCLADTGADTLTERAYVFVGPVGARLRVPEAPQSSERAPIRSAASILLQMAGHLCAGGAQPDSPLVSPVIQVLESNAQTLCDELDRRWPEPAVDRLNLLVDQLDLANRLPLNEQNAKYSTELCMRGLQMADRIDKSSKTERQIRAAFLQRCARVSRRMGKAPEGIKLLSLSAREKEAAGECAGPEYLEISDAYRELSQIDNALKAALQARAAFAQPDAEQAANGAMRAAGRLAQLWRMAGKLDEAAVAAKDGYRAAVELDDLGEQAAFKMDESRIHMIRRDSKAAVTSADLALKIVRRARNEDQEVSAYGTLTLALISDEEWDRAEQIAWEGIKAARQRNSSGQIADFYVDLSNIACGRGDLQGALEQLNKSGDYFATRRNAEKIKNALSSAGELVFKLNNWKAEEQFLSLAAKLMGALERSDRVDLCSNAVHSILHRIRRDGWQASRDYLWRINRNLERYITQQGKDAPEQLIFIRDVIEACHVRSKGLLNEALEQAKKLDEISQGGFRLTTILFT
ncbi:MAG: hypothetical protein JO210_12145 [Acidobacteriaceae bacterium]|nr:hypothetical protein [Acidobacteriaceae bacterium]